MKNNIFLLFCLVIISFSCKETNTESEPEIDFIIDTYGNTYIIKPTLDVHVDSVSFYSLYIVGGDEYYIKDVHYFLGDLCKANQRLYPHEITFNTGQVKTLNWNDTNKKPYIFYGKRVDNGKNFEIKKE